MLRSLSILIFLLIFSKLNAQYPPLVFNFETTEKVYINTSLANNVWQIGKPQKTIFNSSFNGRNVIVTDTINFYPNNNVSEFIIKTPTYCCWWGGIDLYFRHKFDTDTLIDGGTIEVSYDGTNWANILTSPELHHSLYSFSKSDTVFSLHEPGFSGRSKNWTPVNYFWNYPNTDTISLKFKFASDGINNNREGWMIDSLIFKYNLGIGIKENSIQTKGFILYPNPTNNYLKIETLVPANQLILSIYNTTGQELINRILNNETQVDISDLTRGIYFVKLVSNEAVEIKKIIKE